jgi:hypothetical protein
VPEPHGGYDVAGRLGLFAKHGSIQGLVNCRPVTWLVHAGRVSLIPMPGFSESVSQVMRWRMLVSYCPWSPEEASLAVAVLQGETLAGMSRTICGRCAISYIIMLYESSPRWRGSNQQERSSLKPGKHTLCNRSCHNPRYRNGFGHI